MGTQKERKKKLFNISAIAPLLFHSSCYSFIIHQMQWWSFSSKHISNSNGDRSSSSGNISYSRLSTQTVVRPNKRCCYLVAKAILTTLVSVLLFYVVLFRTEFNARVYIRNWVYHKEIEKMVPLSNCFDLPPDSHYIRGYSHVYEVMALTTRTLYRRMLFLTSALFY